jgi:lipopolysaccharide exporter
VLEEQALELRYQAANLVTRFAAMVAGGLMGNARVAIALFTIFGVVVYGSYCLSVIRKSGASRHAVTQVLLSRVLLFLPAAALIVAARTFLPSSSVIIGAAILILIVYYWNVLRTDALARNVLKTFFRRPVRATD